MGTAMTAPLPLKPATFAQVAKTNDGTKQKAKYGKMNSMAAHESIMLYVFAREFLGTITMANVEMLLKVPNGIL